MLKVVETGVNSPLHYADSFEATFKGMGMHHEQFNALLVRLRRIGELDAVFLFLFTGQGSVSSEVRPLSRASHQKRNFGRL